MNIVVVDDDVVTLTLTAAILQALGHACVQARGGAEAFERLRASSFFVMARA